MSERRFLDITRRPGHLVNRVSKLMLRYAEPRFQGLGVGIAGFPVLTLLRDGGQLTQKQLAGLSKMEQSSMAQLLSRLERDGLVRREPDLNDKRSSLISLTSLALLVLPQLDEIVTEGNLLALQGMRESEVEILIKLLRQMIDNLEAQP